MTKPLRWTRLGVSIVALSIALSLPCKAFAGDVSEQDKAQAMQKFDQGSRAFDQKRFKDAIDLFLQADAIVKNPAFAYNASLAYEGMGDTAMALRWAREYLRRAPSAPDQASVRDRIAKYETHLRESGLRQLTVLSTPSGATLLVDHKPVGVTPWTGELVPGSHTLELRLRGYADRAASAELDGNGSVETSLELVAEAGSPVVAPVPAPAQPVMPVGTRGNPAWLLPTSLAVIGAGVVAAGAAVGLEVARAGAEGDARDAKVQVDAADAYDRMTHLQVGARVAAGIAGGLGLIGGTMLTVDLATRKSGSSNPPAAATTSASLSFGATRLSLRVGF